MGPTFRRSRHLACYWKDGGAVVFNYATGMEATAHLLTWKLLDACGDWTSPAALREVVGRNADADTVRQLLEAMVAAGFLEASDRPRGASESAMDQWDRWNPFAGFFHTGSRLVAYGNPAEFEELLRTKAGHTPMPASVKPAAPRSVGLPLRQTGGEFARVVRRRRTWRQFGTQPVKLAELSEVLRLTAGVSHWLTVPNLDEVPLTASPSGGARHPIELYVVNLRVPDFASGFYRYAPDRHELDLVRDGADAEQMRRIIPWQPWCAEASFVVFFSALFERTQWRYGFPRAYRAVLLETGHVCQTFLLAATSLGLAPFCTMAYEDCLVEEALGLNGVGEAVLYAAGAGTRVPGRRIGVMPADMEPAQVRRHSPSAARAQAARRGSA